MARRNRKLNWFDKLYLGFVGFAVVAWFVGSIVMDSTKQSRQKEAEEFQMRFQSGMQAFLEEGSLVNGDKAVCLEYKDGHEDQAVYTREHVPEDYLAEEPAEVRYVIRYVSGSDRVGRYGNGGGAYQKWAQVSVEDLKTGAVLGETKIMGGAPPMSITVKAGEFGSASGDAPDEEEVKTWVQKVLEGKLPEEKTVPEEMTISLETTAQTEEILTAETEAAQPEWGGEKALKAVDKVMKKGWNSYAALIWALEREGFTHEEAVYAADNCGADWKAEALKDARKAYDLSKKEVLEFLELGDFTDEEIAYAMANCGDNWKERAALRAKNYVTSGVGADQLKKQLMDDGFTEAEANYGAANYGR